jgi:ComF family protein
MPALPIQSNSTVSEAPVSPGLLSSGGRARKAYAALLDLVFPPRCVGCGRVDSRWCKRCQSALDRIPLLPGVIEMPPLQALASTSWHQTMARQTVHALKYDGAAYLARPLARRLAARLDTLDWTFDTVIPVPLHDSRERSRGYNQSYLLARELAEILMLPCSSTAIVRSVNTRPQVGLNADQRRTNVQNAFFAPTGTLSGRAILLVDDVFTTGATLAACADAALRAGADRVFGITVTTAL